MSLSSLVRKTLALKNHRVISSESWSRPAEHRRLLKPIGIGRGRGRVLQSKCPVMEIGTQ